MIQARDYQTEAVGAIYSYFANHTGNPIVAMPTGTGKSVVIALFLQSIFQFYPNQRIMVLTHVQELIQQNYEKLLSLWPFAPAGIFSAGLGRRDTNMPITFAGIASVAKIAPAFRRVDLVLIDEAHLVSLEDETMYRQFIQALKSINPMIKVIGFTATPWRIGQGLITAPAFDRNGNKLEPLFTDICFDITGMDAFNRLLAEGYLVPPIPKRTETQLSTDGVHKRGGDFIAKELQQAVNKQEVSEAAIKEAIELGHMRNHWLVFAAGVEHAVDVTAILNDMGVPAVAIHGEMGKEARNEAISGFKSGKYRAAVNNNVLTTGFDFPGIDLILCLRPTTSTVLWVQMLGRGTRPVYSPGFDLNTQEGRLAAIAASGKLNCLVLDYSGNARRLGPVNDPVIPKRKGEEPGKAPVKECEVCGCTVHASLRKCNGVMPDGSPCLNEFDFETKLKQGANTIELIRGELPITKVFKVDHISVSEHRKQDRPPSIRVSYYCGRKVFEEFVCFEHTNAAGKRAFRWWKERAGTATPGTTAEGLERFGEAKAPTHLRVWTNKQYPEIMAYCFDGTAFNTEEASDVGAQVEVEVHKPVLSRQLDRVLTTDAMDDDIPF